MRRPQRPAYPWAVALGVVLTLVVSAEVIHRAATGFQLDLQVFQDAGRALWNGHDLYSEAFPTRSGFRFIYPPFAAILFLPLAPLPAAFAQVVWSAATIVAVWAILAMAAVRLRVTGAASVALALTGLAVLVEPLRSNLFFGQVNVFLFLLVTADVLGFTPRRVRGVLVGLAAGIKITPAAFGLLFLVRRDWASLARSVAAVGFTIVVGHLVRPADSTFFWTTEFFATERGGVVAFVPNQALSGMLARTWLIDEHVRDMAVDGFFVLVATAALVGAWRLTRQDRPVDALLLVALGVAIASPVAVTHHWSGMIIAFPLLLVARRPAVRVCVALLVLTHLVGTHYAYGLHAGEPAERVLQWIAGNAQGWSGILAFAALLVDSLLPQGPDTRDRDPDHATAS